MDHSSFLRSRMLLPITRLQVSRLSMHVISWVKALLSRQSTAIQMLNQPSPRPESTAMWASSTPLKSILNGKIVRKSYSQTAAAEVTG
ncbi:MAG: hypothetical protein MUO26_00665 [Methanotrichaceae archaeon]|nr:hypothetical protein [Methanotrichaceae archaeon]